MEYVPLIIADAPSPAPAIHVTVSSAGPGSLTTVIAVLGLSLAVLSLGWQFFIRRGSGSHVKVGTDFAIFPAQQLIKVGTC